MHETGRADPELVATARQFIAETREAAMTNKIGLLNADVAEWVLAIVHDDADLAARYYPDAAERLHGDRWGYAPLLLWPPRLARCAGMIDEAVDGFRHALEHSNRHRRNYDLASVLFELGRALAERGRGEDREEASGLFAEALGIWQRVDPDAEVTGTAHNNLSVQLQSRGDLRGALHHVRRALEIRRALDPPRPLQVALSLVNSSLLHHELGELHLALREAEESLAIRLGLLGPDDRRIAWSLNALGAALLTLGDLDRALEVTTRSLEIRQVAHAGEPGHPSTLLGLHELGRLRLERGEHGLARANLHAALVGRERVLGEAHPFVAITLIQLARVDLAEGHTAVAEARLERALGLVERRFGPVSRRTAQVLGVRAVLRLALDDPQGARTDLEAVRAIHAQVHGEPPQGNEQTAKTLRRLAALVDEGRAARLSAQAEAIEARVFGAGGA